MEGMWCFFKGGIMKAIEIVSSKDVKWRGECVWWNKEVKKTLKHKSETHMKFLRKNFCQGESGTGWNESIKSVGRE